MRKGQKREEGSERRERREIQRGGWRFREVVKKRGQREGER